MTRVHQALERLRKIEAQNRGVPSGALADNALTGVSRIRAFPREDERAQGPQVFIRRSTVLVTRTMTVPAISELLPLGKTTSIRCPECKNVQEGPRWGLCVRQFLGGFRIAPYRCSFCRRRFSGFDSETDSPETNQTGGAVFSTFLRPDDDRSFHHLIRDSALNEYAQCEDGPSQTAFIEREGREWHSKNGRGSAALRQSLMPPTNAHGAK